MAGFPHPFIYYLILNYLILRALPPQYPVVSSSICSFIHSVVLFIPSSKPVLGDHPKTSFVFGNYIKASVSRFEDVYGEHVLFYSYPGLSKCQVIYGYIPSKPRIDYFAVYLVRIPGFYNKIRTVLNIKQIPGLETITYILRESPSRFLLIKIATTPPSPLDFCMGR